MEDIAEFHTTYYTRTKKNRLRAQQATVSYQRQACETCNNMKIDARRSNELLRDFQRKCSLQTLPLSIPKVEDNFKDNQAYWLKPGKTEPL